MAYDVKFLRGSAEAYTALAKKEVTTFYLAGEDLYLGEVKLSNGKDLATAITRIATNEGSIKDIKETLQTLQGEDTVDGSIKKIAKDAVAVLDNQLAAVAKSGKAEDVSYAGTDLEAKTVESAIAELVTKIGDNKTTGVVTVEKKEPASDQAFATYVIKQGGVAVGEEINIPKDYLVKSASLKIAVDGDNSGVPVGHKYIDFIINTAEDDGNKSHICLDVNDLVDVYTGVDGAEIKVEISGENAISATIKDGAVATAKIADEAVTKGKLASDVQTSLDLADTALQAADKEALENAIAEEAKTARAAEKTNADAIGVLNGTGEGSVAKAVGDAKAEIETAYKAADTKLDERIQTLETAVGDGGSVQDKITKAIEALDSGITETEGQPVTAFNIVDGKIDINTIKRYNAAQAISDAKTDMTKYVDTALTWGEIK